MSSETNGSIIGVTGNVSSLDDHKPITFIFFSIKNSCDNFYIIYTGTPLSAASFMQLFKPTLTSFALKKFKSYFFSILNVSMAYIGIFLILKQIVNAISKQDQ